MDSSQLTKIRRARAIYVDAKRQEHELQEGKRLTLQYQSGSYADSDVFLLVAQAPMIAPCGGGSSHIVVAEGDATTTMDTSRVARITEFTDPDNSVGYGYQGPVGTSPNYIVGIDEAYGTLPTEGIDFYFFGTNYGNGHNNGIYWHTNCFLWFGSPIDYSTETDNVCKDTGPAVLCGNYDRRLNSLYAGVRTSGIYQILTILVFYQNYFKLDTVNLPPENAVNGCQYEIRLIRETVGCMRQWIEVRMKQKPAEPGYSNNHNADECLHCDDAVVDPTKLSPWNITNGTEFQNPCGTVFADASPDNNTSFVFQSDSHGENWTFLNHHFIDVDST